MDKGALISATLSPNKDYSIPSGSLYALTDVWKRWPFETSFDGSIASRAITAIVLELDAFSNQESYFGHAQLINLFAIIFLRLQFWTNS